VTAIFTQQHASGDPTKYAACLLRLEGHDLMDYRKFGKVESGGSDGCIDFEDGDNAGLQACINWGGLPTIYKDWCDRVSLADFLVLTAEAVTGSIAVDADRTNPFKEGSLLSRYRDQFRYGRKTLKECPEDPNAVEKLMPNPEHGCNDLKRIFVDHVFARSRKVNKRWTHTVAISGAHTLGGAKLENSGYSGLWGDPVN
jgi:hypothetical protein